MLRWENRDFFRLFNKSYFDAFDDDSSIRSNADRLFTLTAVIVDEVEHLSFDKWKAKQHIFDTNPPAGYQFASRISQDTLDYVYRDENGTETGQEGVELRLDCYDYLDDFLGSSFEVSSINNHPDMGTAAYYYYLLQGCLSKIIIYL